METNGRYDELTTVARQRYSILNGGACLLKPGLLLLSIELLIITKSTAKTPSCHCVRCMPIAKHMSTALGRSSICRLRRATVSICDIDRRTCHYQ